MSEVPATFNTGHDDAFARLGALRPGQQWSAFDVHRDEARAGGASVLVTTIWNFHSDRDVQNRRIPTNCAIARDLEDGTHWYRVEKPPTNATKTWVAHWNRVNLALEQNIPIVGVLKDVRTSRCSLDHVFDCTNGLVETGGGAIWLQLSPRAGVGCDVSVIDVRLRIALGSRLQPLAQVTHQFEAAVHEALQLSATERSVRLAGTDPLPKRVTVTTEVFTRNPYVVATVLLRAGDCCERCRSAAPFVRRSDRTPYLEVHHKVRLADDGEDTVENAVALCPNCHRHEHYA